MVVAAASYQTPTSFRLNSYSNSCGLITILRLKSPLLLLSTIFTPFSYHSLLLQDVNIRFYTPGFYHETLDRLLFYDSLVL